MNTEYVVWKTTGPDEDAFFINGHECEYLDASSRSVFICEPLGVVLKVGDVYPGDYCTQNYEEHATWSMIAPEDRRYFAATLAYGRLSDREDYVVQEAIDIADDGQSCLCDRTVDGRCNYCSSNERYGTMGFFVTTLAKKYGIGDWSSWQWKIDTDGVPRIHDYAIASFDSPRYYWPTSAGMEL